MGCREYEKSSYLQRDLLGDLEDMFGAITGPEAWPSFLFYGGEI